MAYADVAVVVDGAIDQEEVFHDYLLMDAFIEETLEEAEADGFSVEIFILYHEHAPNPDCCCAQYAADHKPAHTYPARED